MLPDMKNIRKHHGTDSFFFSYFFNQMSQFAMSKSNRGVGEKSLALYPGVPSSIPGSPSLSDET